MRHVAHISLLDDTVRDTSTEGFMVGRLTGMHGFPIRDGENFEDAVKRAGWFDVAAEIEVDPFNQASVTKMLIHPDSDLKDTANNRKFFADQFLQVWAMGERKPRAAPEPSRNQEVIDDFLNHSLQSIEHVKKFLNQGSNVVAVMGDRVVMSQP